MIKTKKKRGKQLKKLLKFIGFGFLGLVALIIIAVACTDTNTETQDTPKEETAAPKETPKAEKKEKKNDPGISMKEFETIQTGMSYKEVVKIIGGEGEMQSETGTKGDEYYTVAYKWNGEKGFGSNAIIMFQGDKLDTKAQAGLK